MDMIENLIGEGVDALCVAPSSPDTVLTAFEHATQQNIPILAVDTDTTYEKKLTFIGTGNEAAAKLGGEYMVEKPSSCAAVWAIPRMTNAKPASRLPWKPAAGKSLRCRQPTPTPKRL